MDIDAEKTQIRIPVRLAAAIASAFLLWWITTYVLPLSHEIVQLKEGQARDKAEHRAIESRLEAAERRADRLEDRLNAKSSH